MILGGETLMTTLIAGVLRYSQKKKKLRIYTYICFAQLRHHQENANLYGTCTSCNFSLISLTLVTYVVVLHKSTRKKVYIYFDVFILYFSDEKKFNLDFIL